jgi:CheY-like chemotaxis protein
LVATLKCEQVGFRKSFCGIKVLNESKDSVTVQFIVKDSGIGIAPEKQQFIFERFQQAEAETTRRFGGTGLGLSIVKQLADLQQGTIKVKSEEGKGSEFQVILSYVPVLKPIEELKQQPKESILSIKDAKLLIAEDNKMNQHLMMHLMNRWQIDFVMVSNGNEAIEAIKKSDFSLIIMDIQMPEMDGYTTTLKIRNELNLAIPIIAMTAHAMPGEKEKCIQLGMNDYLSKPVKEKDLYRVIQQYSKNIKQNSETRLIDLNYLKDLSNGDTEFEQTIISQFIVQVPEELQLLKEAIDKKDLRNIKALAHGMKSSVGYLGLDNKIYPALQRMESEAVNCATDAHFHEDYEQVNLLCCQAVDEACKLVGTVYIEQQV